MIAQHPERQRTQPGRVAERDDAVLRHHDRRVRALEPRHHVGDRVLDPVGRWVESSAAMISESDVERNVTPALAQLAVQLDRVDEVAVVGERDLAPVGAPDRLRVLPRVRAGGRVAHVPDGHVAAQRAQLLLVEHLVDEALVAHRHDVAALAAAMPADSWPRCCRAYRAK